MFYNFLQRNLKQYCITPNFKILQSGFFFQDQKTKTNIVFRNFFIKIYTLLHALEPIAKVLLPLWWWGEVSPKHAFWVQQPSNLFASNFFNSFSCLKLTIGHMTILHQLFPEQQLTLDDLHKIRFGVINDPDWIRYTIDMYCALMELHRCSVADHDMIPLLLSKSPEIYKATLL